MKLNLKEIDKKWKEYALAGCVCILFFAIIMNLGKVGSALAAFVRTLRPVILGFVIAYIVNPMAELFKRKVFKNVRKDSLRWTLSVALSIVVVLLIILLLAALMLPQIFENVVSLSANYRSYVQHITDYLNNTDGLLANLNLADSIEAYMSADNGVVAKIGAFLKDNAAVIIAKTTSIGSAMFNVLIGVIFAIYFLMAKSRIISGINNLAELKLSPLKFEYYTMLSEKFNSIFSKYIVCELLDSAIIGCANYLFMLLAGMPDSLLISVIVGVTNLAPTFGPMVGAVTGTFILLLLKPAAILPFLICCLVLQTLDGYVIKPKLFGDALNVPGFIILIAIIVFGKLLGVTGMLLAIPIAAIIVYMYTEMYIPKLELERDVEAYRKDLSKEQAKAVSETEVRDL